MVIHCVYHWIIGEILLHERFMNEHENQHKDVFTFTKSKHNNFKLESIFKFGQFLYQNYVKITLFKKVQARILSTVNNIDKNIFQWKKNKNVNEK